MRRREFLGLLGGTAAAWPLAARSEQRERIARIRCLGPESASENRQLWDAFLEGLHSLGYVEGRNVQIEFRWADHRLDRLVALAKELIGLNVDVIVTHATGVIYAHRATATIPIVMASGGDVIAQGIVASLAHPGGNVTGSTFFLPELVAKRLDLLKQAAPSTTRVGVLMRSNVGESSILPIMLETAKALRMELRPIEVGGPSEFESAFSTWADQQIGAVVAWETFFPELPAIAALAAKYRIASIGPPELAASGGLIGYGVDLSVLFRRAAVFVDKILKGANPGDIPIEQATKFRTVVNLKTAKALGIEIPAMLLAGADEVIE